MLDDGLVKDLKSLQFGDMDKIGVFQKLFYKEKTHFYENRSLLNEALKVFLMYVICSEMINTFFKRGLQIKDAILRN